MTHRSLVICLHETTRDVVLVLHWYYFEVPGKEKPKTDLDIGPRDQQANGMRPNRGRGDM